MSTSFGLTWTVFALLMLCTLLQIADVLSQARADMKGVICGPWRDALHSSDRIKPPSPLNSFGLGHDYITGSENDNVIKGGYGKGCYNGGPGSDTIYINSRFGDEKYVIDDDRGDGADKVFCEGKHPGPGKIIIEGNFISGSNDIKIFANCNPYVQRQNKLVPNN
jgi:hypothetical protein